MKLQKRIRWDGTPIRRQSLICSRPASSTPSKSPEAASRILLLQLQSFSPQKPRSLIFRKKRKRQLAEDRGWEGKTTRAKYSPHARRPNGRRAVYIQLLPEDAI